MCEITARTKPRVDFIIILLFKVPRVSDFAFAFFHRASSFLLFPSTYVVLHFLSFISHSFSTSFSLFFSFPQSQDSHPPVHTSPLLSATCPGSFYLSEQEAEAPTLPIFLSLLSPAHPSISLFLQWGVSYCSPNRVINPARGNELRVTPASTTQLALRVHVCASEIDKLCISLCVHVCMLGAFSYFDRLCVQTSVGCNDTFFLNTVIGCNSIITLNLLKLLRW